LKSLHLVIAISSVILMSSCSNLPNKKLTSNSQADNEKQTRIFYENIINKDTVDLSRLNLFFTQMPKGGDLHHHYSGTIYAETYLDWVKAKSWFIDQCTLKIVKTDSDETKACPALTVDELLKNNASYRKLLTLWSDKDYDNHFHEQPAPDTSFFNTFGYFRPISKHYMDKGLAILKQRAINENVSYIETMLSTVGTRSSNYFSKTEISSLTNELRQAGDQQTVNKTLDKILKSLNKNKQFNEAVDTFVKKVATVHTGIDNNQFTMRYQTYAVRVLEPVQVFTDLLAGYLANEKTPLLVGVNIVAPENNYLALSDYTLHMQMYNYLLNKFPNVNRALHAGELTLGMVRPKDLTFHIKQARDIAKAQRIGHGIDIPYEKNSIALLNDLKENSAIEINLTSNQFILGVEKNAHPYQIYAAYGVPMVISTDDSGVSRNNLTNEFMLLASRYKPNYALIKTYVYNSIKYSFLSDDEKTKQMAILDKRFVDFEKEMVMLMSKMR